MKLNYLFLLLFPILSFGQSPRIAFLASDSILLKSEWYALLKEDVEVLTSFVKDSIVELEQERYRLRYEELLNAYTHSCGHGRRYEMEIEQEIQDRQESLQALAETAEEFIIAYEDSLLVLWEEELIFITDSLMFLWKYDLVLRKEVMVFLDKESAKEQGLFEEAIIKKLNQKIDKVAWATKTKTIQEECIKNIQQLIYVHPVDVKKKLSKLDVFRRVALWMHGAKLT